MITTELSILVPCFNNESVLAGTIDAIHDVVTHNSMNVETLLVDDQSTDGTLAVAKRLIREYPALHIRVFERSRRFQAYGSILRFGLAYATGRYCVVVSADGYDSVELIPKFLEDLRKGAQLVQCSRYIREEDAKSVRLRFRMFQHVYRFFVRALLGANITDTTNGFRAFDRNYVLALGIFGGRRNVFPEITFKVLLSGGRIEYVAGKERRPSRNASRFKLRHEILGYAAVLARATLHRWGIAWF
jgi:dolichol-phosphate mannosyltransferase